VKNKGAESIPRLYRFWTLFQPGIDFSGIVVYSNSGIAVAFFNVLLPRASLTKSATRVGRTSIPISLSIFHVASGLYE
jgi:hypothetical protein